MPSGGSALVAGGLIVLGTFGQLSLARRCRQSGVVSHGSRICCATCDARLLGMFQARQYRMYACSIGYDAGGLCSDVVVGRNTNPRSMFRT